MSAAATTAEPTTQPDANPDSPAVPTNVGRLLILLRLLINFGKVLANALQQDPDISHFPKTNFGRMDIAQIFARIVRGLHLATALEAKLNRLAARGRDLTPTPDPSPSPPRAAKPAAANPTTPRTPRPADPDIIDMPTAEEIAALVRRQPVGRVIANILRDLGVVPEHMRRADWDDLARAIMRFGGSLGQFYRDMQTRAYGRLPTMRELRAARAQAASAEPPPPQSLPVLITGPP
jgi:hypothetical protein